MASDPPPTFELEAQHWRQGRLHVAGLDEVGRGPLAGPVVAGAALFEPDSHPSDFGWVRDSKDLTRPVIERRAREIREGRYRSSGLIGCVLGAASVPEIDHLNIRRATILAMRRALRRLERHLLRQDELVSGGTVDAILVDGSPVDELGREHDAIPRADRRSLSVACASILAKDTRDRLMENLASRHPDFACWASDHGYASPAHREALAKHGPVRGHHRMSFTPCAQPSFL